MTTREVVGRYKGSAIGLGWSLFHPILLLAVYTFVFSVVFKARWGATGSESRAQFALILFVGLIIHGLFAEVINRSPSLVLANQNYVKKVVFPVELLPIISIGAALFHAAISLGVLLAAFFLISGFVNWTVLWLPVVLFPFLVLITGISWILASLGVFLRDVSQTVGIVTMVMMFMAPVVYPITAVPEQFRPWLLANPITFIIEQARQVVIWGALPNFGGLFIYLAASSSMAWIGYVWFQKTRPGFADVL
ncbi:ABC transporter permease [Dyella subtropica]|uniref:ABC transporter permease n=1 Tax=Dyella subtropica TaxID=2992127 RepID=UPI0022588660|nr:ABC transporter permease [Dyella subtropica]